MLGCALLAFRHVQELPTLLRRAKVEFLEHFLKLFFAVERHPNPPFAMVNQRS
jgi:hypothetical protein